MNQPRAASLPRRGHWGQGLEGFCPDLVGALHPICCQFREVLDHPAGATKEKQTFLEVHAASGRLPWVCRPSAPGPASSGSQMLEQYENLTVALAENPSSNSPEHQQHEQAAQLKSEIAQRIHTIGQKQRNEQLLLPCVQALLGGRQAKGLTWACRFLRQGWLLVLPPRGEPLRMFFLFSDLLLVARP